MAALPLIIAGGIAARGGIVAIVVAIVECDIAASVIAAICILAGCIAAIL